MAQGFSFKASDSPDVVAYQITLLDPSTTPPTEVNTKVYQDADIVDPDDPTRRKVDLGGDPDFPNLDGTYTVQIRSVDDAGNRSPALTGSISVDFVPPDPPTGYATW